MKQIILTIVAVLLITACKKESVTPNKTTTTYSCTQKNLDLYIIAQDIKYCQSNLAQSTQSQRNYWINRIDENRKKYNEISAKPCI